jgi:hypothetical protein
MQLRPYGPHYSSPTYRVPPALAALIGTGPFETRFAAAKALDKYMAAQGMRAPGKPSRLAPSAELAAALARPAGAAFERADLMEVVAAVLEPMEPFLLTHDIE